MPARWQGPVQCLPRVEPLVQPWKRQDLHARPRLLQGRGEVINEDCRRSGLRQNRTRHLHGAALTEPGQAAFGVVAEIVARLDADPLTDWSKVEMPSLLAHLRDMDNVFGAAEVALVDLPNGASLP